MFVVMDGVLHAINDVAWYNYDRRAQASAWRVGGCDDMLRRRRCVYYDDNDVMKTNRRCSDGM